MYYTFKTLIYNIHHQDTVNRFPTAGYQHKNSIYQFAHVNIKPSKKEWNNICYYSRLLIKPFEKLRIHNNILVLENKEYNQIVLRSCLRNIVYNQLHNNMGHLRNDKVFDLAGRRFYWRKIYRGIELHITKQC